MDNVSEDPTPALSMAALQEWTQHAESVMRGLAHALNNRAAALSAIIELSQEPDDDPDATREILGTELERVRELAGVVRAMGPATGGAEAFAPHDVLPEVLALLRLHADQRDRTIEIDAATAPPVRVPRWMLQRALVVLCAAAPTSDPSSRTLRARLVQDGDWLVAAVEPPADGTVHDTIYVAELARGMGGDSLRGGFRIPTLEAVRRREAR